MELLWFVIGDCSAYFSLWGFSLDIVWWGYSIVLASSFVLVQPLSMYYSVIILLGFRTLFWKFYRPFLGIAEVITNTIIPVAPTFFSLIYLYFVLNCGGTYHFYGLIDLFSFVFFGFNFLYYFISVTELCWGQYYTSSIKWETYRCNPCKSLAFGYLKKVDILSLWVWIQSGTPFSLIYGPSV